MLNRNVRAQTFVVFIYVFVRGKCRPSLSELSFPLVCTVRVFHTA